MLYLLELLNVAIRYIGNNAVTTYSKYVDDDNPRPSARISL